MVIGISHEGRFQSNCSWDLQSSVTWEDVTCPICLDFPHNCVLLQCSSYDEGCHPFMCDTDHRHSNCLERFKAAYGMSGTTDGASGERTRSISSDQAFEPKCPLCRGDVTGWIVVNEARMHLNMKVRCCEEKNCTYFGNYLELQKHSKLKHPNSRPSDIDPARKLDWENLQQSSEVIDVLSTIHSEVPRAVVLGDYVIEYGDDDTETGDEFDDFPRDDGNWWTSCILYQVFDNFRASRNRRRSRVTQLRAGRHRWGYEVEASNLDEGSTSSVDIADYRFDETDDHMVGTSGAAAASRGSSSHRRSQRHHHRSRFHDP